MGAQLNTIFCATPDFALPCLELLANHPLIHLQGIISMPDRPAGRGQQVVSPPVIQYAKDHLQKNVRYWQTANLNQDQDLLEFLHRHPPDLIIVLAFAQFLGTPLLELPRLGCFNIHTSLLPKYRGAAPIQYALLNGDTITGVSIQKMVRQMDAGDIALCSPVPIYPADHASSLSCRLKFQAARTLDEFLFLLTAQQLTFTGQDPSQVSFAPQLQKEDGKIDFLHTNPQQILNQVRALNPWPGTFCFLNNKRLKILAIEVQTSSAVPALAPGELNTRQKQLLVGCLGGTIRLRRVQFEGKNICQDDELRRGIKTKIELN